MQLVKLQQKTMLQQKGKFKKSKKAKIKKVNFSVIDECRTQAAPSSSKQNQASSSNDVQ